MTLLFFLKPAYTDAYGDEQFFSVPVGKKKKETRKEKQLPGAIPIAFSKEKDLEITRKLMMEDEELLLLMDLLN